jgi:RNA recognition motif-containing protein
MDERDNNENKIDKRTEVEIGLDISTSVIGVCILEKETGNILELSNIKLTSTKFSNLWEKATEFENYILSSKFSKNGEYVLTRIFVEANAKMFTPGFSSADTILTLAKFNGICSYIIFKNFGLAVTDINVTSARSKLKIKIDRKDKSRSTKEKVREQFLILYPNISLKTHVAKTGKNKGKFVLDKENEDMIDAAIIAIGGKKICGNQ